MVVNLAICPMVKLIFQSRLGTCRVRIINTEAFVFAFLAALAEIVGTNDQIEYCETSHSVVSSSIHE